MQADTVYPKMYIPPWLDTPQYRQELHAMGYRDCDIVIQTHLKTVVEQVRHPFNLVDHFVRVGIDPDTVDRFDHALSRLSAPASCGLRGYEPFPPLGDS